MSSFDIAAIVSELKSLVTKQWISNVYQIDSLFTIKFRTKEGNVELLIEPAKRVHLTKYERQKPKIPSKFCMTLRKYLRNQRVLGIEQHEFDRVIIIEVGRLSTEDEIQKCNNKLIVEFFERGNLVLLDSNGKVIIALSYRTMRDRRIIPNREFNFAPSRGVDINKLTLNDLKAIFQSTDQNLIRTLIMNLNISPIYAEEICFRVHLEKEMQCTSLSDENLEGIFEIMRDFISSFNINKFNPGIYEIDANKILAPIELIQFSDAKRQNFDNFNTAADEFFSANEEIKIKTIELKDKKTDLTKTDKILKKQEVAIQQLEQGSVRFRRLGDILYQNFQSIEELLISIKKARSNGKSWKEIETIIREAKKKNVVPAHLVKKIDYTNAILLLNIEGEEFPVDFRKSVADNANNFYTKAKKSAAKLEGAKAAYQRMLKQKDQIELEAEIIAKKETKLREMRKKHWYEKFHWFISSDGFLVIGGRDLKTNELIVKRYMAEEDIFFHAVFHGAPVVVVKTEGKQVPEQTQREAAQFEITFSSAWKSQYGQADVYYVLANQVSQTPPSGEYLQKGSFIIRGTKNPFKNVPLKLRLGVKFEEKFAIVMSGPPEAIKKHTQISIEITFGDKSGSELAKLIKAQLLKGSSNESYKEMIRNIPLDEIQRALPGGRGEIKD
ncbi:MAG TPA: ribosome rescue protein RqcH [Candidatus Deferrimicrobium sp.]|nr:ribosome rescue protein RqcH [Candidatus Deferrimicrobium sp.]